MSLFERIQSETQAEQHWLTNLPLIQNALKGDITREKYIAFLSQAYHHVKQTVPLMMACGSQCFDQNRWAQSFMAEYIDEEIGHEKWILSDITAAGGDAEAMRLSKPAAACELMIAYAYDMIHRVNPLGFFGMIYVLEGTSVALATHAAEALQQSLSLPKTAFSYLISHGHVDQEHILFLKKLLDQVENKEDQDLIIHTTKRFFKLYGNIFQDLGA
jgi:pyrroloquinoline quinone (PQQ) biosynthesis protein C